MAHTPVKTYENVFLNKFLLFLQYFDFWNFYVLIFQPFFFAQIPRGTPLRLREEALVQDLLAQPEAPAGDPDGPAAQLAEGERQQQQGVRWKCVFLFFGRRQQSRGERRLHILLRRPFFYHHFFFIEFGAQGV